MRRASARGSASDDLQAGDAQFEATRNAGFTTVLTVGRTGIFNGQSAVIDLAGDNVSAMVVQIAVCRAHFVRHDRRAIIRFAAGNVCGSFGRCFSTPSVCRRSRACTRRIRKECDGPRQTRSLEALFPIVNGKMPVVFNANTEREIIRAIDLIKRIQAERHHRRRARIVEGRGPSQGGRIFRCCFRSIFRNERPHASPEADPEIAGDASLSCRDTERPRQACGGGCEIRVSIRAASTTLGDFFTNAGKAVENGLSSDAAIRAMTLGSAEMLGRQRSLVRSRQARSRILRWSRAICSARINSFRT